jgi:hypothetical protein
MALVELFRQHPELPTASWDIQPGERPTLHGHIHDGGMDALRQYAELLGGSIRPEYEVQVPGQPVSRSHYLRTVWQDVPVSVVVLVPLSAAQAVAA